MPFCTNCGSLINESAYFCDKCGTCITKKSAADENIILGITWKKEIKKSVRFTIEINNLEIAQIGQGETISINCKKGMNKIRFTPNAPKWFGWKPLALTLNMGQLPHITLAIGSLAGNMLGTWQLHIIDIADAVILEQQEG